MKKSIFGLFALGLILMLAASACGPTTATPTATPTPITSSPISSFAFYWNGNLIQNPANSLTLGNGDCSQPLDVSTFSVAVTTNTAVTIDHQWIVMILTQNPDNTMNQQNLVVGPQTSTAFNGASTQTFDQDTPFSLNCGTYTVALGVNYPGQGGFLMEQLIIQAGPTPVPPTPTTVGGQGNFPISKSAFYWGGNLIQNPANSLTLNNGDCSQPLNVNSFSVNVTTSAAATFDHLWIVMIITKNPDNTVNQQNLVVGPQTSSTFNSASTQMINQDIPFSLPCGTYTVALAVTFPGQGGFLMEQLIIQSGDTTPTPVGPVPPQSGIHFIPNINAYCRSGPNVIFGPTGLAMKDQTYPINGRNLDNTWLYILLSPQAGCWVPVNTGSASGDTGPVRVLADIPTPTFTPIPPASIDCSVFNIDQCRLHIAECTWTGSACKNP